MKISTEIASAARLVGEEKAVELVAKAGFEAWDFSLFAMCRYDGKTKGLKSNDHPLAGKDYLAFARKLKQIGLDNGIVCNQSHAPFPVSCPQIQDHLKRAIECTAEAGGKICVIHPDNNKQPEENAQMYLELLPFAKACGVKIATENMWNPDKLTGEPVFAACGDPGSFCAHVDAVNDPFMVACLDVGHAELRGIKTSAYEMIRGLGGRLQALHLHDNDKIRDKHWIPFAGQIDFEQVTKALAEIGYQGDVTMEADAYLRELDAEQTLWGLKQLAGVAGKLRQMIRNW